jgi:hypothetical protein
MMRLVCQIPFTKGALLLLDRFSNAALTVLLEDTVSQISHSRGRAAC